MFEYGNRDSQSIKYIFDYQSSPRARQAAIDIATAPGVAGNSHQRTR
jgi:hypothetical protein